MKKIKSLLFSALLTFGAFGAMTLTSCSADDSPVDPCAAVVCQNGGVCESGNCNCPAGYEGALCETRTRDKFIGTWSGTDVCGSGSYTITLKINAATNEVSALIENPGGFGTSVVVTGNVTGTNSIGFTNVSVGGGRTLTGTMTFTGGSTTANPNAMQFVYTVTPTTGSADNCTGNYTRL